MPCGAAALTAQVRSYSGALTSDIVSIYRVAAGTVSYRG
jgi:hypothetical protein